MPLIHSDVNALVYFSARISAFLVLFVSAGILASLWALRKSLIVRREVVPVAVIFSSLCGYIVIWVYLASPKAGRMVSITWLGFAMLSAVALIAVREFRTIIKSSAVAIPLILIWIVSVIYLSVLLVPQPAESSALRAPARFLDGDLPVDDVIPLMVADHLDRGNAHQIIEPDWHMQDRTPLQSGIVLLFRPLLADLERDYQVLGTLIQLLWIPAALLLLSRLDLSRIHISLALALLVFSGFMCMNTLYVWPKLYGAALSAIGLALLLQPGENQAHRLGLASAAFSLGILAHQSAIIALLPIGLIYRKRILSDLRSAFFACLVAAVLLGPWVLFQNGADPPGNRLAKWHLAGQTQIDDKSVGRAVVDNYKELSFAEGLELKFSNIKTLVGIGHVMPSRLPDRLRTNQFYFPLWSLGVAAFGLVALVVEAFRKRVPESVSKLGWSALIITALWCAIMFGPKATVSHQGPYLLPIIAIIIGAWALSARQEIAVAFTGLQILLFSYAWVWDLPYGGFRHRSLPAISIYFAGTAGLLATLWLFSAEPRKSRQPPPQISSKGRQILQ